jgi:hypothetical protein
VLVRIGRVVVNVAFYCTFDAALSSAEVACYLIDAVAAVHHGSQLVQLVGGPPAADVSCYWPGRDVLDQLRLGWFGCRVGRCGRLEGLK